MNVVAATAGQTAAPWWKRNEKLHRATSNPTPVALRPPNPLGLLVLDPLHLDVVADQLIDVRHHRGRLDVH